MSGPSHKTTVRVRYSEVDLMGVAHNSSYLHWFEIGRTELLRTLGFSYRKLEEAGYMLPVTESYCRYLVPARYDEELEIRATIQVLKPRMMSIECFVHRADDGTLLASGYTRHVCALRSTGRPTRLPDTYLGLLGGADLKPADGSSP